MKKFVVLLVVVAMTFISAVAYADVTIGGELAVRSRNFSNFDFNDDVKDGYRDTQTRFKLDVNAKVGDVKGKLQLWNDWERWGDARTSVAPAFGDNGGFETSPGEDIRIREAWVNFNLPGIPVNVTAGHQLLTLGNGWFFRSMHYGSDAWVVANQSGNNTLAFVNIKVSEGVAANSDDVDAYTILDVIKLSDTMTVGVDATMVKLRPFPDNTLINIAGNFNGKLGPVALKAQLDLQMGEASSASDYAGNQIVVQGSLPLDPVTVNFTVARGSGDDAGADRDDFVNFLDVDPHYTLLNEYKIGAGPGGDPHFGFSNTTALGVGVSFAATKSLTVGADAWWLQLTEKGGLADDQLGQEVDVKLNWKVAENLAWNWVAGVYLPGDAWGSNADNATGVQGILSFKF